MATLVLGIDVGTTSTKVVLADPAAGLVDLGLLCISPRRERLDSTYTCTAQAVTAQRPGRSGLIPRL